MENEERTSNEELAESGKHSGINKDQGVAIQDRNEDSEIYTELKKDKYASGLVTRGNIRVKHQMDPAPLGVGIYISDFSWLSWLFGISGCNLDLEWIACLPEYPHLDMLC